MKIDPQLLFKAARSGHDNAYAPYSKHQVGAAVLTSSGKIFSGCNMENATYGATVCAERGAIHKAVSEGEQKIAAVLVFKDSDPTWPPCGICLQVIAEFAPAETPIFLSNGKGIQSEHQLKDLLPQAFKLIK